MINICGVTQASAFCIEVEKVGWQIMLSAGYTPRTRTNNDCDQIRKYQARVSYIVGYGMRTGGDGDRISLAPMNTPTTGIREIRGRSQSLKVRERLDNND